MVVAVDTDFEDVFEGTDGRAVNDIQADPPMIARQVVTVRTQ